MKIMNKSWLKIIVVGVLIITVIAGVYIYLPADKPVAEPENPVKVQKQKEPALQAERSSSNELSLERSRTRRSKSPSAQWLADTAPVPEYTDSSQTSRSGWQPPKGGYYRRRPDVISLEPSQEGQLNQLDIEEAEVASHQYINRLRSRPPVEMDRPDLSEQDSEPVPVTEEQIQQINEDLVMRILEEYKDNPRQAEQLRKILDERLEYFRQQRAAAKADVDDE